ncbi:hypothetical protein GXP71_00515 [Cellulomonas sp. H30R-01]|uniref:hypothetical protein n=1 Tax=Cellulomonas sp. H30R-01 TaxID=2704467 RepID=UPI00138CAF0D|nr:hypothetical protein [Cellulomonas sp. H30R-01]QHT54730.1 hypothetical protein GXP71_00515 [Cellulomonas sp. H30R-01]
MSAREDYDRKTAALVGLRIEAVEYWDIHLYGEPREWDHGDWHHAVMGVGLTTSTGPVSVLWTNTFYPHGVEVFPDPMTSFLRQDEYGPENWSVTDHPEWRARTGQPITAATTHWEQIELGPGRNGYGRIVEPARTVSVPVALRLDFAAGPVWFIAGIPQQDDTPAIPDDEIVIAFTTDVMLRFGYPADPFTLT